MAASLRLEVITIVSGSPGLISPNFFRHVKNCRRTAFGKKIAAQFHQLQNFKLKLAHFSANFFCCLLNTVLQKNVSHPVRAKKPCSYVDEIDPLSLKLPILVAGIKFNK